MAWAYPEFPTSVVWTIEICFVCKLLYCWNEREFDVELCRILSGKCEESSDISAPLVLNFDLISVFCLNSVQIAKLSMIPVSCFLEIVLDNVRYSRDTKLSILLVLLGVGICTVNDVSVNTKGFIAAFIAVWSTALQQYVSSWYESVVYFGTSAAFTYVSATCFCISGLINCICCQVNVLIFHVLYTFHLTYYRAWCIFLPMQYVHYLQRKYSLGSFNLLGHTAPIQATSLLLLGPLVDYWLTDKRVDAYNYTSISLVSTSKSSLFGIKETPVISWSHNAIHLSFSCTSKG